MDDDLVHTPATTGHRFDLQNGPSCYGLLAQTSGTRMPLLAHLQDIYTLLESKSAVLYI